MFHGASKFGQDIAGWNVSQAADYQQSFYIQVASTWNSSTMSMHGADGAGAASSCGGAPGPGGDAARRGDPVYTANGKYTFAGPGCYGFGTDKLFNRFTGGRLSAASKISYTVNVRQVPLACRYVLCASFNMQSLRLFPKEWSCACMIELPRLGAPHLNEGPKRTAFPQTNAQRS